MREHTHSRTQPVVWFMRCFRSGSFRAIVSNFRIFNFLTLIENDVGHYLNGELSIGKKKKKKNGRARVSTRLYGSNVKFSSAYTKQPELRIELYVYVGRIRCASAGEKASSVWRKKFICNMY